MTFHLTWDDLQNWLNCFLYKHFTEHGDRKRAPGVSLKLHKRIFLYYTGYWSLKMIDKLELTLKGDNNEKVRKGDGQSIVGFEMMILFEDDFNRLFELPILYTTFSNSQNCIYNVCQEPLSIFFLFLLL